MKRHGRLFNVTTADEVHSRFYADLEGWLSSLREKDKKAWIKAAVARRHEARSKQRARVGRERSKVIRRAIAKRGELWR